MDAISLLIADHNRVRGLFTRFEAAHESQDVAEMTELAAKIVTELDVHTRIEEEIFYPTVAGADEELHETVAEGVEEHHVAKTLMQELRGLTSGDDTWTAKMTVLIESVQHHAGEEESELFPEVRKAFDEAALEALGSRLEARKAQLGAPTTADKAHLSVAELRALASDQQIPGRASMNREQLMATVAPG